MIRPMAGSQELLRRTAL